MHITLLEPLGVPQAVIDRLSAPLLAQGHSFSVCKNARFDADVIEQAKEAGAVIVVNRRLGGDVLRALPALKFVSVAGVAVDKIDCSACRELGIALSNAPDHATDSVAELTICLMLTLLRRVTEADEHTRSGGSSAGLTGRQLRGKTVGVVGTGNVGMQVARLCRAFGCRVIASAPREKEEALRLGVTYVPLDELMKEADVITLHVPQSEQTRGLIDGRRIGLMKPSAVLLNLASGAAVDAAALSLALKRGGISGAAADVYEKEPPLYPGHPLLGAPNMICTPHIGGMTEEALLRRAEIAFENVAAFLAGRQQNVVL